MSEESSNKPSEPANRPDRDLRQRLIGLGERSIKKSYFPELKERRRELERFREIMDRASDAIVVFEGCARVVDVNQTACTFLGLRRDEILGRDLRDLFPTGSLDQVLDADCAELMGVRQAQAEVLLPADPDAGRAERILELSFAVGRMEAERWVVAVGRDVTARRKGEEELRAARDRAEAASRTKSEFLANVSHELRTPLTGVLGMLQLLSREPGAESRKEYTDIALASAQGLLSILNDILDLSVVERGEMSIHERGFSPADLVTRLLDVFAVPAAEKDLILESVMDPDLPEWVMGDDGRIRQILFNLVGNAIKFTPQGTVRVVTELVRTRSSRRPCLLLFTVTDTGIGIPPEKLDLIFQPFTQADGSLTRKYGGVGLGLAIIHRLVNLLGGSIHLESDPGQGTQIHLAVPVRPQQEPEPEDEIENIPTRLDGCRILVVDDEPTIQVLMRGLLDRCGAETTVVSNGQEAIEALREQHYHLVFMDIQMPVLDGLEAARRIRSGAEPGVNPAVPLVALTAHAQEAARAGALRAGMNAYLSKPMTRLELLTAAARVMGICKPKGPGKN